MTPDTSRSSPLVRVFRSPDDGRLRVGWRLALQILIFFVLLATLTLCVSVAFGFIPPGFLETLTGPSLSSPLLAAAAVAQAIAAILSVVIARRRLDRRSVLSLGLGWDRRAGRDLLVGIGLAGGMIGVIFLIERAAGWLRVQGAAWETAGAGIVLVRTAATLVVFVVIGLYEELIFRGYWLQNLLDSMRRPTAIGLSAIGFALGHAFNPSSSAASLLGLFLAGIFFAYAYLRTRNLWLPIGLHIGWNFFVSTVFGFPVSGIESFNLLRLQVEGPTLWTGGGFGPEAGLVLVPALALGALALAFYPARDGDVPPDSAP